MEDLERRIAQARGDEPADLVLRGGRIFDLITGTMMAGDVAICGDRIAVRAAAMSSPAEAAACSIAAVSTRPLA